MRQLMRSEKKVAMHRRYQAVYLHMFGKTYREIATEIGLEEHAVGKYIRTFYVKGVEGLVPIKQEGRPTYLTADQQEILKQTVIENTPDAVGFKQAHNWTVDLAIQWCEKEFGVTFENSGMRKLLHRMGLRFTRPTYVLKKAAPEKQAEFTKALDDIKEKSATQTI